jgi:membrane-associated HD superfamily phosphohydrolase
MQGTLLYALPVVESPETKPLVCGRLRDRQIAQKQRETLQSSCSTFDEKLAEGKEALNNICEVMKSLEKNAKTAKDQIKEQKENILKSVAEKLDERAEKMNEEVDKVYGELHSELSKQHDEMKDYLDKVQDSVSLPKNLMKRGSIEEMLSSQKLIDEKIEKLSNQQPENLAAVNDGSIQYVPDDIGNINVDEIVDKLGHVEGMCNLRYITVNTLYRFRFDFHYRYH